MGVAWLTGYRFQVFVLQRPHMTVNVPVRVTHRAFFYGRLIVELLSGGEMVARALEDEGVEYIFGYPGGAVLHIYDALFQQDQVRHILAMLSFHLIFCLPLLR